MAFSLSDKHILVNYHYVEDPNESNSGMHPCPVHEFEEQIVFLSKYYTSAPLSEVFDAAKKKSDKKLYSVTFDDGLKDQYQNAVPILKKHRVHGTFFIITGTLEGFIPYTHKLHILLSRFSPLEIIKEWNLFVRGNTQYVISTDRRWAEGRRLYEDIPPANIKEVFSRGAPKELRDKFITSFFKKNSLNEDMLCKELFMNEEEIKHIAQHSLFEIGNHTHNHEILGQGKDIQTHRIEEDFKNAEKWFERLKIKKPTIFSYPHGLRGAPHILRRNGIMYGVIAGDERPVGAMGNGNGLCIPRYEGNTVRDFLKK